MTATNLYEIAKTMECQKFEKGDVVYQYGNSIYYNLFLGVESDIIYTVIEGSVELLIPQRTVTVSSVSIIYTYFIIALLYYFYSYYKNMAKIICLIILKLEKRQALVTNLNKITEVCTGQCFGEKSFLNHKLTSNKAVWIANAILAVIHK